MSGTVSTHAFSLFPPTLTTQEPQSPFLHEYFGFIPSLAHAEESLEPGGARVDFPVDETNFTLDMKRGTKDVEGGRTTVRRRRRRRKDGRVREGDMLWNARVCLCWAGLALVWGGTVSGLGGAYWFVLM